MGPDYCKDCISENGVKCPACPEPQALPENQKAMDLYVACDTQWRCSERGIRLSLDYVAVRAMRKEMGMKKSKRLLSKIKTIESAMLTVEREKVKAAADEAEQS